MYLYFQAKSVAQVDLEKDMMQQDKVWVVHRRGFSLGIVDKHFSPQKSSLSSHVSIIRSHVRFNIYVGSTWISNSCS